MCALPPVNPNTDPRSCITRHRNKGLAEGTEIFPLNPLPAFQGSRCATLGTYWVSRRFATCGTWKSSAHTRKTQPLDCFRSGEAGNRLRTKHCPSLPCTEGNSEVKTGGLVRFLSFPEWSSPGEGLEGEGAVFFFCPNNLMKFGSSAGGIEISSRYTVCLCLINVNLPRAPSTPRAPALH